MRECRCFERGFQLGWTREKIIEFKNSGNMCSHSRWICANIDKELRRTQKEADQRRAYEAQLRRKGMTKEEIDKTPTKARRRRNRIHEIDDS